MNNNIDERPTAFIVMPSDDDFTGAYEHIITPPLEQAGYRVVLAVNMDNAQNIMKDIIRGIADSTLIVADLTGSNRNVYYEVGIAHALGKPVILITQDISDLPFDIQSYRVIEYDERVGRHEAAIAKLKDYAEGNLSGTTVFGNPVSDFLVDFQPSQLADTLADDEEPSTRDSLADEPGEPEFLNFLEDLEEGSEELAQSITGFNEQTSGMTEKLDVITERITARQNQPGPGKARDVRALVLGAAAELSSYADALGSLNGRYSGSLDRVHTGFEGVLKAQEITSDVERKQLADLVNILHGTLDSGEEAQLGVDGMIGALRDLGNMERTFDRAKEKTIDQLLRFRSNIELTKATFTRIVEICEETLRDRETEVEV